MNAQPSGSLYTPQPQFGQIGTLKRAHSSGSDTIGETTSGKDSAA